MFSRKKPWAPSLSEIHEYTLDLQRITMLRDKCTNDKEKTGYSDCIHVMQEVLIFLNTEPNKQKN
jgi:hypothetical protein